MRKLVIFLVFITLVSGCSTKKNNIVQEQVETYKEELVELGYSEEIIKELENKLEIADLETLSEYDYIEVLLDIINDEEFKHENLDKYLSYYENGMNASAVVYIVNNDISYTYNEKLVSIMNHNYFIANNLDRYMVYDSENIDEIITNVNTNIDRDFYKDIVSSDTTKGNLLIVNKYYKLDDGYYYGDLVTMSTRYSISGGQKLNHDAYDAFKKLVEAGEKEGVYIRNLSAYRSYGRQSTIYNNYKKEHGLEWTDKWSARPGHSEHQTGLALDVTKKGMSTFTGFEDTKEFTWISNNAHKFGFILRYPENKSYITGYGYEPWHYRYVGVEVATYIYENDITFEEYYAYFVENKK